MRESAFGKILTRPISLTFPLELVRDNLPKILFMSDLHGDLEALEVVRHLNPDLLVLCGDICPKKPLVWDGPILFTHGNHDNISKLRSRISGEYKHLETYDFSGIRFLVVGGVFEGTLNFVMSPENLTSKSLIDELKHLGEVDVIVTHEAPLCAHPNGEACFNTLLDPLQPKLWIYGHHHESNELTFGKTRFVGLSKPYEDGFYALL